MSSHDGDPIDWWLRARSVSGEDATSVALGAIDEAVGRLQPLGRLEIRQAFVAIAEGTWWVAALDEQFRKRLGGRDSERSSRYAATRDADPDGQYVRGFLWARDRHTHQLPFSSAHDDAPAFGHPDAVIHLSRGLVWRPSSQLSKPERVNWERPEWRDVYDELMAEQQLAPTLARCAEWFHKLAGHGDHVNWEPPAMT